jgi:hypothetical protein
MNALVAVAPNTSMDLAAAIDRARSLFNAEDYQSALMLSSWVYDQAQAAAGFARRMQASEEIIGKALRMQADALLIESRAKMALADQYDQAKAAGMVATQGRPKKVSDENLFRLEDIGLSKAKIFDARKLREAEIRQPGILQQKINERVELGLEPSRANLRAAIGTASANKEDRGDNFYQTPAVATRTLLALESFSGSIWEPACGLGAISHVLEQHGYDVVLSDLLDRGTVTGDGELQAVGDFLASTLDTACGCSDIITNPPYGDVLNDFVAHALRVHKPQKMALLLNLNFLCGFADEERNFAMDENPPARIYVFKHRLPMMHREGWSGPKASSRMNTAWYVWERQPDGGYGSATLMQRVDWKDFEHAEAMQPGELGHAGQVSFDENYARETPRKTLDERTDEMRAEAVIWGSRQIAFSRPELRRGIGVRDSVAEALIWQFLEDGMLGPVDEDGTHTVIAGAGWAQ